MESKSSNGWKFFALLFGAALAAVVGLYIYKLNAKGPCNQLHTLVAGPFVC